MATQLAPGSTFAGYRIEALVGRGGMGAVYRATGPASDDPVALKLVLPEFAQDPLFRARFERESRLTAALSHPHVLPLLEAGERDGALYLVTAFVQGTDLEAVIAERGALHPAHAVDVVAQVAAALDAAGERGLVHRDVKPGNVLLERRDGSACAYLADFGLSRHMASQSGLTTPGTWVGTVDYAAPEQIQAQDIDPRTDVYALGCVLFETLTGRPPFRHDRDVDKLLAHIAEEAPPPSEVRPGVPPELDEVVARAMAKVPGERYGRAGDLGTAATEAARAAGPAPDELLPAGRPAAAPRVDRDSPTVG